MSAPPPTTVHNQSQKTQIPFRHVRSKVLGVIQIIIGVLCFVCMVVSIVFGDMLGSIGHGIWNGILIIGFMVMCIISAVMTSGLLVCAIMGICASKSQRLSEYECTTSASGNSDCIVRVPQPDVAIAMEMCIAILAVIEAIVAIWGSAISCGAVCCYDVGRERGGSDPPEIPSVICPDLKDSRSEGKNSKKSRSRPSEVFVTEYAKLVVNVNDGLGEGGFGVVYKARHTDWGTVAYKKMNIEILKPHEISNLKKEAKIQHSLDHPNIVKLLGLICEPNYYGIVLEYMEHGDMMDYILEMDPLSWKEKLHLVQGVVLAMSHLHSRNIIHGDLKMQNVLIDGSSNAKVCDFGLSLWEQYTVAHSKTTPKQLGTPSHFPPEFIEDSNMRKSEKFDVYGFGIFLWQTMTQKQPFATVNSAIVMHWVQKGQRPSLDLVPKDIPESSVALMEQCWNQVPDERPSFPEIEIRVEQEIGMLGSKNNREEIKIRVEQEIGMLGSKNNREGIQFSSLQQAGIS